MRGGEFTVLIAFIENLKTTGMEKEIIKLPQDSPARERMNIFAVQRGYMNWEDMHGQSADYIEELTEEFVNEMIRDIKKLQSMERKTEDFCGRMEVFLEEKGLMDEFKFKNDI